MNNEEIKQEFDKIWKEIEKLKEKFMQSDAQKRKRYSSNEEHQNFYFLISNKLNTKEENIRDYICLEKKNPKLLFDIKRENSIQEQIIFLLIFLSIRRICYGKKEIESSELRRLLAEHQISAINNLSTNVKKLKRYVSHKAGKRGSKNTFYRITEEGFSKGLEIISKILINKEDPSSMELNFLNIDDIKRKKNNSKVGEEIDRLVEEGFFKKHRKMKEVRIELRNRGFFNRRQDIDAYIRKSLLGKKLIREKNKGIWEYVLKK